MAKAQTVLERLAEYDGPVRLKDLAARLGEVPVNVRRSLRVLGGNGLARSVCRGQYEITDLGRRHLAAGRKVRHGGHRTARPRRTQRTVGQRVWQALRIERKATLAQLLPLVEGSRAAVMKYLRGLELAGYCRRYGRPGEFRWLLTQDTGPRAPVWNHTQRRFHDLNTGLQFCPIQPEAKREKTT